MLKSVEAVISQDGSVRLLESVKLSASRRAIVTILDDEPLIAIGETALLSEDVLAQDWLREEEDEAWQHLQGAL